jgi:hypothetical protein
LHTRLAAETYLAGGELFRVAVKRDEFLKVREKNSNDNDEDDDDDEKDDDDDDNNNNKS